MQAGQTELDAGLESTHEPVLSQGVDGSHDPLLREIRLAQAAIASSSLLPSNERERLSTALVALERRAGTLLRARQDFLAVVSHELRTPLTSILGFLEIVLADAIPSPEDEQQCLESALESARDLHRIVNDILEMAELEAGSATFTRAPVDLLEVLRDEIAIHAVRAKEKGLESTFVEPGEALPRGFGDARKLSTVMRHLLSNAVKFTAAGGIRVETALASDRKTIRVKIADTGVGFSPELASTLSEAFLQAEHANTRTIGGMGLGLTLALHLIRRMGGCLELRSEGHGRGATVSFTVPVAGSAARPATRS